MKTIGEKKSIHGWSSQWTQLDLKYSQTVANAKQSIPDAASNFIAHNCKDSRMDTHTKTVNVNGSKIAWEQYIQQTKPE